MQDESAKNTYRLKFVDLRTLQYKRATQINDLIQRGRGQRCQMEYIRVSMGVFEIVLEYVNEGLASI